MGGSRSPPRRHLTAPGSRPRCCFGRVTRSTRLRSVSAGTARRRQFWVETMTSLGHHLGLEKPVVEQSIVCVDSQRQWAKWRNVWYNSAVRSVGQTVTGRFGVDQRTPPSRRERERRGRRPGRRFGTERSRGGGRACGRRSPGHRAGGCSDRRRRLPHRGADPSGFLHDVCSAAHPLAVASPFFRRFDLAARGVRLLQPELAVRPSARRRPGRRGRVASVDETAASLGRDASAIPARFSGRSCRHEKAIVDAVLSSMRAVPPHPLVPAGFALRAVFAPLPPSPGTFRPPRRGRCSPASRCTAMIPSTARSRAVSACCSGRSRTPSGGRSPKAAADRSPTRWQPRSSPPEARSAPGSWCGRSASCRPPGRCCST